MLLATLALAVSLVSAEARPATAEEVAKRVEARAAAVKDMKARFVQTYRSPTIGRELVERGRMSLKRPGRMRWEYEDPEKKTFVSDGTTFYFYVPADRQVIVRDRGDARGVASLLLSGEGRLLSEFQVSLESSPAGRLRLRLTPKREDPDVERVYLDLDPSFRIRAIDLLDPQGSRSRFEFEDVQENVGLSDKLFRFEIPKGVEVVQG